jgi:hypothetical protein
MHSQHVTTLLKPVAWLCSSGHVGQLTYTAAGDTGATTVRERLQMHKVDVSDVMQHQERPYQARN